MTWSKAGAGAGELTFVTGHPGGTDRALTVAQLRHERDVALPDQLLRLAELRGLLTGFQLLGDEQKRISTEHRFYVENSYKALRGRLEASRECEECRRNLGRPCRRRTRLPATDPVRS